MSNEEMLKMFLIYQKSRNLSPRTIEWYEYITDKFLKYLSENKLSIETLTTLNCRAWINALQNDKVGYKQNSVNCHIRAIKTLFNYLVEDEFLEKSPFAKVSKIRVDKVIIDTFTPDEIKKMLSKLNRKNYVDASYSLMFRIMYDCGLRVSEIIHLKTNDILLEKNMLKVFGKAHKERLVPFGRSVKREIIRFLPLREKSIKEDLDEGFLFCSKEGTKLDKRNINRKIKIIGEKADVEGKRLSAHTFRHSTAKNLLLMGCDLFSVQAILGHESLDSTRRYINLLTEDVQRKHRQFSPLDNL